MIIVMTISAVAQIAIVEGQSLTEVNLDKMSRQLTNTERLGVFTNLISAGERSITDFG